MENQRGSFWRKCDFHIHTPLSELSNNFSGDFDGYVQKLFKKAIEKKVEVIGITDYFTIEGYKKIKQEYLSSDSKLRSLFSEEEIGKIRRILVLPNIEFRLNKIVQINKHEKDGKISTENGRVNMHVLFSEDVPIKTIEENFLHDIQFIYEADPNEKDKRKKLKIENLFQLGERLKREQPDMLGTALQVGMTNAIVDDNELKELLVSHSEFNDRYLIVTPADEDLSKLSWKSQEHLTRKIILSRSHAFFSSNSNTIAFGLGDKSPSEDEFITEFKSLKPCIWGSDAHDFDKMFEPDDKKYCWVKADATFEGIRQILFEPRDRVYIGEYPEIFTRIRNSRGNYIKSLKVAQVPGYDGRKGVWFNDFNLDLGYELTAIIGNKGKGKSALADIIALLGNSHVNRRDFSFLNNDKFCQRGFAENFIGKLTWWDTSSNECVLNAAADVGAVERVKYIPQAYLEKLCNNEDNGFKEEINKVVFSRLDDSDKLGKKSFDELERYKSETINQQITILTNRLAEVNGKIDLLEHKALPDYRSTIENRKATKQRELELHNAEKTTFVEIQNPENDTTLSEDQRKKAETAGAIQHEVNALTNTIEEKHAYLAKLKIRSADLINLIDEVNFHERTFREWKQSRVSSFNKYELDIDAIISVQFTSKPISRLLDNNNHEITTVSRTLNENPDTWAEDASFYFQLDGLKKRKNILDADLEKPFKDYQEYLLKLSQWDQKYKAIVGTETQDGTITFFDAELAYLENVLPLELSTLKELRLNLAIDIFEQKRQIQEIYNKIKRSISSVLEEYSAEQNITIESSFKIDKIFYNQFFDYVNRYGKFYSNGDEALRKLVIKYDFDDPSQIRSFIEELQDGDIRYKDGRKIDFFSYICSLNYLRPEYDLRLNGKSLNQLSPGEKGGLLLVFYLVLDKDNKPLIIDQPEDNLDNQSVAEILVPYIKRAKRLRQIIMVTHNPNLAIVADAEQIIYMNIDKESDYKVSYDAGGIENSNINNHIVNILEGKMKAFNNRRIKYKEQLSQHK